MARYTGPQWKISRRLGFSILENGKELNRRAYAPGQHGQKRKKQTEYGLQLAEKQKVRHMYGVNEKQFHNTFNQAAKAACAIPAVAVPIKHSASGKLSFTS